jgi:ubiquinone/menaquinone biosynthesis C-methylase UbiE
MESGSAHLFGALYSGAGDAQRKAAFVGALLPDGPGRVVDTAAGVGDVAFLLAREGHTVLGFEPCREMYAVLFDRFSHAADIRHLAAFFPFRFDDYPLDPSADAVVASNHWSHLDPAARESLLARSLRGLRSGGLLVMNCAQDTPLRSDQPWDEVHKRVFGNLVIRHFASSTALPDGNSRRVRFEYRMEYEGGLVHAESTEYVLTLDSPDIVSEKLAAAGFVDIRLRGGFADTDYDPRLPGFVVVARKPSEN